MRDAAPAFEVHYHPPVYPDTCFPGRCTHPPEFKIQSHVEIVKRKRGGAAVEIDHVVCLGCGASLGATHGGNVLVDVSMCLATEGPKHWRFALRLAQIRNKWARIATHLFNENGWNGRHQRIAKMIDPNLTMKLFIEGRVRGSSTQIGRIAFDSTYIRTARQVADA